MKIVDFFWDSPELKPFAKSFRAGDYIFRQGDVGNTLFIIVKGVVELVAEKTGKELVIGIEQAGNSLGEGAVTSEHAHARVFGARARTDVTVIELGWVHIEKIAASNPTMMLDILKRMFQLTARRLGRMNQLAELLRSSKNVERLVKLILHFGSSPATARRLPNGGRQVMINVDRIRYYIDMSDFEIEECFKELEKRKLLIHDSGEFYNLPDEKALLKSVPLLREALPNLTAI